MNKIIIISLISTFFLIGCGSDSDKNIDSENKQNEVADYKEESESFYSKLVEDLNINRDKYENTCTIVSCKTYIINITTIKSKLNKFIESGVPKKAGHLNDFEDFDTILEQHIAETKNRSELLKKEQVLNAKKEQEYKKRIEKFSLKMEKKADSIIKTNKEVRNLSKDESSKYGDLIWDLRNELFNESKYIAEEFGKLDDSGGYKLLANDVYLKIEGSINDLTDVYLKEKKPNYVRAKDRYSKNIERSKEECLKKSKLDMLEFELDSFEFEKNCNKVVFFNAIEPNLKVKHINDNLQFCNGEPFQVNFDLNIFKDFYAIDRLKKVNYKLKEITLSETNSGSHGSTILRFNKKQTKDNGSEYYLESTFPIGNSLDGETDKVKVYLGMHNVNFSVQFNAKAACEHKQLLTSKQNNQILDLILKTFKFEVSDRYYENYDLELIK